MSSVPPDEPVHIPIEDIFDLHSIPPRDCRAAVQEYLHQAHLRGLTALRIIHGRGTGVQRQMVRGVLASDPNVISFTDAPAEAGGWGATLVTLGDVKTATKPPEARKGQTATDELSVCVREYDAALADAEDLVHGLTDEQFNWRVKPGTWSIGECLDHLAIIDRMYGAKLTAAIEQGRKQKNLAQGPFHYSAVQSWLLRMTEPPPKFRVKAPGGFKPTAGLYEPSITMEEFRKGNRQLAKLTADARGLHLAAVKVPSPIAGFWKWSIGIVLRLGVAHERRHLYQARRVKSAPGFPSK